MAKNVDEEIAEKLYESVAVSPVGKKLASFTRVSSTVQAQFGANVMIDDWEENLDMITANRTKDDELVLIHLGDCLWKETSNITRSIHEHMTIQRPFRGQVVYIIIKMLGSSNWSSTSKVKTLEKVKAELLDLVATSQKSPTFSHFMKDLAVPADTRVKAMT
ncbi:unnamed protein product [Lactuca virosa]|uniref:Sec16 Sec23-binding domain-containing protein n=1 Tax=Lactuca virosa TaxID=75947 RepID=A0AAU9MLM3_9ASTR|nr:unnamed protein product [Lactuca virosa]